ADEPTCGALRRNLLIKTVTDSTYQGCFSDRPVPCAASFPSKFAEATDLLGFHPNPSRNLHPCTLHLRIHRASAVNSQVRESRGRKPFGGGAEAKPLRNAIPRPARPRPFPAAHQVRRRPAARSARPR